MWFVVRSRPLLTGVSCSQVMGKQQRRVLVNHRRRMSSIQKLCAELSAVVGEELSAVESEQLAAWKG